MPSILQTPLIVQPDIGIALGKLDPEHVKQPYDNYAIHSHYARRDGKIMLPVAQDDTNADVPVVIVRTHARCVSRIVQWNTGRQATKPVLPSVDTEDPNQELLTSDFIEAAPAVDIDADNYVYVFSGVYVYACLSPVIVGEDDVDLETPPYVVTPVSPEQVVPADFDEIL